MFPDSVADVVLLLLVTFIVIVIINVIVIVDWDYDRQHNMVCNFCSSSIESWNFLFLFPHQPLVYFAIALKFCQCTHSSVC